MPNLALKYALTLTSDSCTPDSSKGPARSTMPLETLFNSSKKLFLRCFGICSKTSNAKTISKVLLAISGIFVASANIY